METSPKATASDTVHERERTVHRASEETARQFAALADAVQAEFAALADVVRANLGSLVEAHRPPTS